MKTLLLFLITSIILIEGYSQCPTTVYKGDGTYYSYESNGACSMGRPETTTYIAAINNSQYGNAELCGACAEITGPIGTVVVTIADKCPECIQGDLDMEYGAFSQIANPILGRVNISWKIVPCPVSGPISIYFKEGTNPWWIAAQVRNHRTPISKVEMNFGDGNYVDAPRASYNYFIATANNASFVNLRITDVFGSIIEMPNVQIQAESLVKGTEQFPTCQVLNTVEYTEKSVKFFPNPAEDRNIHFINEREEDVTLEVTDILGNYLKSERVEAGYTGSMNLPCNGTYLFKITSRSDIRTERVVVH